MFNNLKEVIEKDFDKNKNYNSIISKVEAVGNMKKSNFKYALAPICLVFVVVIAIITLNPFQDKTSEQKWLTKTVVVNREEFYQTNYEYALGIITPWEDLTISEQYSLLEFSDSIYDSKYKTVSADMLGNYLGEATASGYDESTDTRHYLNATIYEINNISSECVVAVQLEGTTDYYVYINAYYKPETLGDFVSDLNLKEIISFGTIYYDYWETDKNGEKQYQTVEFPDVDNDIIWDMLFSDLSLENIHEDNATYSSERYASTMSISVDIPLFGYENISVVITDKGYLTTNILDTGKTFYIGEDKAQAFVNYIIENYDGYVTVYVDENGIELTDDYLEEDSNTDAEEFIVVEYNTTTGESKEIVINSTNQTDSQNYVETYTSENTAE